MQIKNLLGSLLLTALLPATTNAQTFFKNDKYTWKGNTIQQGQYKARANSATDITSNYKPLTEKSMADPAVITSVNREHWVPTKDVSHLPHYESSIVLDNALYNMSLEESELAIEPDSTFRTGIFWGGVWTRDVSYSILHSLAQLQPEVSMKSLRHKVTTENRIIQDTGTGGAYPCSTDRMTWVLAAWEIYKVTGSREWLDYIFPIIRNSVDDDRLNAFDSKTGMYHGETSWLDWREQEYPHWAEPADIYQSEALGTNAVHFQTLTILSRICALEGQQEDSRKYAGYASKLKDAINKNLWIADKGYYGIYLYGRDYLRVMNQQEILGQALCVLFGIADDAQAKSVTEKMAQEDFGTPDLYPNLSTEYPYHNDAMWPFTQAYWMKACQKAGNENAVMASIASLYRASALFLTNQENLVITTGDYMGLPINSPRQLWSVAAGTCIAPNVYFGIHYEVDGIRFAPFVPKALKAERRLSNFKYRDAVLDMHISGFGNGIASFKLDGNDTEAFFPGNLKGNHTIEITMNDVQPEKMNVNFVENDYLPSMPEATVENDQLSWKSVEGAKEYRIIFDGTVLKTVAADAALKVQLDKEGEYAVVAVGENGWESFMSNPVRVAPKTQVISLAAEGKPYTEITRNKNVVLNVPVTVSEEGNYVLYWKYANGNGPITTENKCAIRELKVDGVSQGVSIFPHRGSGEWDNLGFTNSHIVHLKKGAHAVSLEFNDHTENMNYTTNAARIYELRVVRN